MNQITLLTGPERRRRWHEEDRRRIVEAAFAPGAIVTEVARRYEVSTGLIYTWRRQAQAAAGGPAFARAVVVDDAAAVPSDTTAIVVELSGAARVRISATAPVELVTATLRALR